MSFVKVELKNPNRKGRQLILKCDFCYCEFIRRYVSYEKNKEFHFCSNKCKAEASKCGGPIDKKYRERNQKKYGVDHPSKLESTKQKQAETNFRKYGVKSTAQLDSIKEKQKQTNIKKYGHKASSMSSKTKEKARKTCFKRYNGPSAMCSEKIKEKSKETCVKNHGVPHSMMSDEVRKKSIETCRQKYGTESVLKCKSICEKARRTLQNHYGVDNPLKSEKIKEKVKKTMLKNWGVENPSQSEEIRSKIDYKKLQEKAHLTMKKRKNYGKSKIEDEFYKLLCDFFGESDIERSKLINGWGIDFYVKSLDLYIQFDGVYWHGLNKPIEEIKKFANPRDKVIFKTFLRDLKQNQWFEENNINLLRIRDENFRKSKKREQFLLEKISLISERQKSAQCAN